MSETPMPTATTKLPAPREGRCKYYMARKQRYCTVILDGRAAREGWGYCYDHKQLVDAAGGVAPQPPHQATVSQKEADSSRLVTVNSDTLVNGAATSTVVSNVSGSATGDGAEGDGDARMPCPYSTLHTIRKQNYWHHLKVCPHKPTPSVEYCTVVDKNIINVAVRRPEGARRPLFAELSDAERAAFIAWVEERYEALGVEESILVASSSSSSSTTLPTTDKGDAALSTPPPPLSVAHYVRPSLKDYVSCGREKEATQHVALTNIAHLAFFSPTASEAKKSEASQTAAVPSFPQIVVRDDAMRSLAESFSSSSSSSPSPSSLSSSLPFPVGFLEYGAGKGGLVAAMRLAYPLASTIVVDRDMFRDMKDAQLAKGMKRGRGGDGRRGEDRQAAADDSNSNITMTAIPIPHVRLKMNVKDFAVDKCLQGLRRGVIETSVSGTRNARENQSDPQNKTTANGGGSSSSTFAPPPAASGSAGDSSRCACNSSRSRSLIAFPSQWIGLGKHLCGGCTDMTLVSVVEARRGEEEDEKETSSSALASSSNPFSGVMIATCCHHMCSADTYVWPALFGYAAADGEKRDASTDTASPASHQDQEDAASSSSVAFERYQHLLDCCCGTAGWGISGDQIDAERRLIGRKVKRLLDYGRVQYLKKATKTIVRRVRKTSEGGEDVVVECTTVPLFSFVGMVQYTSTSTTEENEVLVAIP